VPWKARYPAAPALKREHFLDRSCRSREPFTPLSRLWPIKGARGSSGLSLQSSFSSCVSQGMSHAAFAFETALSTVCRISRRQGDGVYQGAYLDPFAPSSLHAQMWPAEVFGPSVLPETLLLFGLPRLHWAELVSGAQASLRTCVIGVISGGGRPALRVPT
jgi:hypothetical protein